MAGWGGCPDIHFHGHSHGWYLEVCFTCLFWSADYELFCFVVPFSLYFAINGHTYSTMIRKWFHWLHQSYSCCAFPSIRWNERDCGWDPSGKGNAIGRCIIELGASSFQMRSTLSLAVTCFPCRQHRWDVRVILIVFFSSRWGIS